MPRWHKTVLVLVAAATAAVLLGSVARHKTLVAARRDSPFDYLRAHLATPFAGACPAGPVDATDTLDWPPVYMLVSRPPDDPFRRASAESWKDMPVVPVNASALVNNSPTHSQAERPCGNDPESWKSRLFHTYQLMFDYVLQANADASLFLFLEDDAVLADVHLLKANLALARGRDFLSLYRPPARRDSCIYAHGTVAFTISRAFMQRIAAVRDPDVRCRLAIDMYISSQGPWFVGMGEPVLHNKSLRFRNGF